MPTPERQKGQTPWARRQQQQQQHTSPFRRARHDPLRLDASNTLSPPRESPARHRRNFSQTGTLRGAFEFTSRPPLAEIEDDLFLTESARRGSPYKRRQSTGAMSSISNSPELDEAYRQIDDANSLTDLDPSDDENAGYGRRDKLSRKVPTPKRELRLSTASDASLTSDSSRRRFTDYARDEERLKRATMSRSPVLDRAVLGNGPTSDHLIRRGSESNSVSEEDYGAEPALKAPANWGSRARSGNTWMKSLTRSHERTGSASEKNKKSPSDEVTSKSAPRYAESREVELERPKSRHGFLSPPQAPSPEQTENLVGGQKIPNTPISVYPSSTFTKRSPTKRDSHDLLRKLARAGSPSQTSATALQTPEQSNGRSIYDKTPVVTGAWIDTPVTERAPAPQSTDALKVLGSKLDNTRGLERLVEGASQQDDEKPDTEGLVPDLEPMEETAEREQPVKHSKEEPKETSWETKHKQEERPIVELELSQNLPNHRTQKLEQASKSKENQKPVELPLPDHPRSALETVLQDHQNNKESLDVGDDTLESLQAIMDQQPSEDTVAQEEDDVAYEQQVIGELESAQPANMNDFDRIEGKLQSLSDTMSHLKSGLNQLGNRVSRDTEQIIASLSKSPEKTEFEPAVPGKGCKCKPRSNGVVQNAIPIPRLWKRGSVWWMTRPTTLGWCTLVALAWYFSESTMCDYYCHPLVDDKCEGNCLLPDAPRFPFVIPTMLWRWLHLSDILLPLWAIIGVFFRFISQLLGLSDGYLDDEPTILNLTGKIYIDGTQVGSFPTPTPADTGFPPLAQLAWKQPDHTPEPISEPVPDQILKPSSGGDWDDISMDEDDIL
ncbi:uncharacterized protein BDV17DRAFT_269967 [Aspergillus undulatus]|uniref:uncharacterized protein n=1 Tax=Aspergillus undulatus TaxID=1810928 RepID=UPI003CCD4DC6